MLEHQDSSSESLPPSDSAGTASDNTDRSQTSIAWRVARLTYDIAIADLKRSRGWLLRQTAFLAVILALLFVIIALPQSVRFAFIAEFEHANYDIVINGELTEDVVPTLRQAPAIIDISFANRTSPAVSFEGTTVGAEEGFVFDQGEHASRLWAHGPLLIAGEKLTDGVAIDWSLARELGAQVGSEVLLSWITPDGEFQMAQEIQVILAPTGALRHSVITTSRGPLAEFLASRPPEFRGYTDAFIRSSDPSATKEAILAMPDASEFWIRTREEARMGAAQEAADSLPRAWQIALTSGFLMAALLIVSREQRARLQRRRFDIAILSALGARLRWIGVMHTLETIAVSVLAVVPALFASRWVVQSLMKIYLPPEATLRNLRDALIIFAVLAAWGALRVRRRLKQVPVSRLLSSDAVRAS